MTPLLQQKYDQLIDSLRSLEAVAVAFSGGVDSTLLLWAARDALGNQAVAVTATSLSFPQRERTEALDFCRDHNIPQILIHTGELQIPGFRENPPDRCYLCKKALFTQFLAAADAHGLKAVAEGSNLDDEGDYRPGMRAIRELGIRSPLRDANLSKAEIRELSRDLGLPTWDKPSYACLASRFVYGETITDGKLAMVDQAEQLLQDLGFRQARVRVHGTIARIEVLPDAFPKLMEEQNRKVIYDTLKALGFAYVTLDLGGYRTGSMNEPLFSERKSGQTEL